VKPRQHSYSDKKLDELQRLTLDYFPKETNPVNGLVPDSPRQGALCSVAPTGFALAAYPIRVERGSITRDDAIRRKLATLRFFGIVRKVRNQTPPDIRVLYYHFCGG
jgi:hypothetical protein